jgi:hypothetical protein
MQIICHQRKKIHLRESIFEAKRTLRRFFAGKKNFPIKNFSKYLPVIQHEEFSDEFFFEHFVAQEFMKKLNKLNYGKQLIGIDLRQLN